MFYSYNDLPGYAKRKFVQVFGENKRIEDYNVLADCVCFTVKAGLRLKNYKIFVNGKLVDD